MTTMMDLAAGSREVLYTGLRGLTLTSLTGYPARTLPSSHALPSAESSRLVDTAPTATKQKPIRLLNSGRSRRRCFLRTRRDARETGDALR
jgi:hypothetical protein